MRCKNKSVNLTVVDYGGGFNLYCISKCFDFHAHLGSIPIFFLLLALLLMIIPCAK